MQEEHVVFSSGNLVLEGLYCPGAHGGAVICHPHPLRGGSMDNNVVEAVTMALSRCGLATVRFNFRGVGASSGTFSGGVDEKEDVKAAVCFIESRRPDGPLVIGGYSFGAHAAIRAAAELSTPVSLLGVAPPLRMMSFDFVKGLKNRILFLAGDLDPYCPLDDLRRLTGSSPEVHYAVIAGADHFFGGMEGQLFSPIMDFVKSDPLAAPKK